jgi:hypothetical protein
MKAKRRKVRAPKMGKLTRKMSKLWRGMRRK